MLKNLLMDKIGKKARIAAKELVDIDIKKKNEVLREYCNYLNIYSKNILKANKKM